MDRIDSLLWQVWPVCSSVEDASCYFQSRVDPLSLSLHQPNSQHEQRIGGSCCAVLCVRVCVVSCTGYACYWLCAELKWMPCRINPDVSCGCEASVAAANWSCMCLELLCSCGMGVAGHVQARIKTRQDLQAGGARGTSVCVGVRAYTYDP